MDGRTITKTLEAVFDACGCIQEAGACDKCPVRHCCLDTTTFSEVCDIVSVGTFDEMLGFAKDIDAKSNEEDMAAYYADVARKAEQEERMITMAWGY